MKSTQRFRTYGGWLLATVGVIVAALIFGALAYFGDQFGSPSHEPPPTTQKSGPR